MKCLNAKCNAYNKGECMSKDERCGIRIVKTLNYAEEQLEHAKDKENRCYDKECAANESNTCTAYTPLECTKRIKEPINYEEEYNKIKKENGELIIKIDNRDKMIEDLETHIRQSVSMYDEARQHLKENEDEKEKLRQLLLDKGVENSKIKEEIIKLRGELNVKETQLSCMDKSNQEIKEASEILVAYGEEIKIQMDKLKAIIVNQEKDIEKLCDDRERVKEIIESKNKSIEEFGKSATEMQIAIEDKDIMIEILKSQLIYAEVSKDRDKLLNGNKELKAKIENKQTIKDLRQIIKNLAEML